MKHPREVSVNGYISVIDKDKSGNPLQIAINADDFSKYVLRMDEKAAPLLHMVDKRVHIRGLIIGEDPVSGNPIVKLLRVTVIQKQDQH